MRSDHFGTERLKNLLTAFTNVPQYEIIWKFESTNLPIDIPKNVHIKNWVPQSDILGKSCVLAQYEIQIGLIIIYYSKS